jgi:hypothetical protein
VRTSPPSTPLCVSAIERTHSRASRDLFRSHFPFPPHFFPSMLYPISPPPPSTLLPHTLHHCSQPPMPPHVTLAPLHATTTAFFHFRSFFFLILIILFISNPSPPFFFLCKVIRGCLSTHRLFLCWILVVLQGVRSHLNFVLHHLVLGVHTKCLTKTLNHLASCQECKPSYLGT